MYIVNALIDILVNVGIMSVNTHPLQKKQKKKKLWKQVNWCKIIAKLQSTISINMLDRMLKLFIGLCGIDCVNII
jgi:hypothetical protein